MSNRGSFLVALLILASSATALAAKPVRSPQLLKGEIPEADVLSEVTVGEALYARFDYIEYYGARLTEGYESKFMLGMISIPRGLMLVERPGKERPQYCSAQQLYRRSDLNDIVCFQDLNEDGAFEEIRVPTLRFGGWARIKTAPVPYEEAVDQEQTNGFRQELLYQGVAGSSLSISYREFKDNFARPAFQQDLQYTLSSEGETEIAFRGARIIVMSATNTTLRYKVVSGIR